MFLEKYIKYASMRTDAPIIFHECCGLFLLSCFASRFYFESLFGKVKPNIWFLLLGESSITRKTTAISFAEDILLTIIKDFRLADDYSPEALISDLSSKSKSQGAFVRDEFGGFLADLKKSYMKGMKESFMKLYDCPVRWERKIQRQSYTLNDVYIPLLTGTTITRLKKHICDDDVLSGFLPRFFIVRPNPDRKLRPISSLPKNVSLLRDNIIVAARKLHSKFSDEPIEVFIDKKALEFYNNLLLKKEQALINSRNDHLAAFFSRQSMRILKIAILYAFDAHGAPSEFKVDLIHIMRASNFVKHESPSTVIEQTTPLSKVLAKITRDSVVAHSTLLRDSNLKSRDMKEVINTLIERNQIEVVFQDRKKLYKTINSKKSWGSKDLHKDA